MSQDFKLSLEEKTEKAGEIFVNSDLIKTDSKYLVTAAMQVYNANLQRSLRNIWVNFLGFC